VKGHIGETLREKREKEQKEGRDWKEFFILVLLWYHTFTDKLTN